MTEKKNINIVNRFAKTSITYFIGNVSTKIISFVLIPLYTSYLNPAEYGEYDLIITILNLIVPLAFFQIWDGVFRFAFDKDTGKGRDYVINNGTVVMLLGCIIFTIVQLIASIFYKEFCNGWVFAYGIMLALQYEYTVVSRIHLNNTLFSISGIIDSLFAAIINIVLIVHFGFGIESLYIAAVIGMFLQILFIEIFLKPLSHFKFKDVEWGYIKEIIAFSLPLCISTVSYWMLSGFTKLVISDNLGVYDNGLYAVANKFTSLILLAVSVFQFAWNEMVYILAKEECKEKLYERGIRFIFKLTILSASVFMFISKLIFPFFVAEQYQESLYIIPLSMVGVAMNSLASFSGTLFLANKKSNSLFSTTVFAVVVNVILTLFLTSLFDLPGAVIALSLSLTVLAITRLFMLKKLYGIKLDIDSLLTIPVLIISGSAYYLLNNNLHLCIAVIIIALTSIFFMKNEIIFAKKRILNRK